MVIKKFLSDPGRGSNGHAERVWATVAASNLSKGAISRAPIKFGEKHPARRTNWLIGDHDIFIK
jgi:hypothetical protein